MPELRLRIGCVVLAVIMSAVTYYLVEPRLRWGRFGGYKAAGLLSVMISVGVAGYSVERHDGYTARMNDPEQAVIDAINKGLEEDNKRCLSVIPDWNRLSFSDEWTKCRLQREPGKNTVAIIGDSQGGHLYPGLSAQSSDSEGVAAFTAACAVPLIGLVPSPDAIKWDSARATNDHLLSEGFSFILSHSNIRKVILSHKPSCSYNAVIDTINPDNRDFDSILHDGFSRTYSELTKAGKEIYVVLDNPVYQDSKWQKCKASVVKRPLAIPDWLSSAAAEICSERRTELVERKMADNWNKVSHEAAQDFENVHFIDLEKLFCPDGSCSMLDSKGNLIYRDAYHLNIRGSVYAAPFIARQLRQ